MNFLGEKIIKNLKTKEKIADAFLEEISNTSLANISINNLTSKANVSRSTFYRLFDSIPSLIDFINDYVDYEIFLNFTNNAAKVNSPEEWLAILVNKLYQNREKLKIMYSSDLKGQWINYLSNKYHDWLRNNIFLNYHSKLIPKDMAILLFTKEISSIVDYWISKPIPVKPKIFEKQIIQFLNTAPLKLPNL